MARKTEERIEELKQLRAAANGAEVEPILAKALTDKSGLVVAEAARVVAARRCIGLIPAMLAAYARFFENAVKSDPKCWAKTAIVKALVALEYEESAPFLRASKYVQMEPVWGGSEDSATHLRGNAILALVQCSDLMRGEVLRLLVDALADPSEPVRVEAVRALEQMNGEESALVLRMKAHAGDEGSAVVGQVFDSLLALDRDRAVGFVAGFLESENPEVRDEAALSLGASRMPEAVRVLIETWKGARDAVLLRALSASRDEAALTFLLDLVRQGISREAALALEALSLHAESPDIQARIDQARRERQTTTP
jgi:HEAT repeat protein